jgi:uncharacterized protein (UPF0332 family)
VADDLLKTAHKLLLISRGRPRQSDLRRAISSAYYALFHAIATDAANLLVGARQRAGGAWSHAYRSLDHTFAKKACTQARKLGWPPPVAACADAFIWLQEIRQKADYDPDQRFLHAEARLAIRSAGDAIARLRSASKRDRRTFAVHLLLRKRSA